MPDLSRRIARWQGDVARSVWAGSRLSRCCIQEAREKAPRLREDSRGVSCAAWRYRKGARQNVAAGNCARREDEPRAIWSTKRAAFDAIRKRIQRVYANFSARDGRAGTLRGQIKRRFPAITVIFRCLERHHQQFVISFHALTLPARQYLRKSIFSLRAVFTACRVWTG